MKNITAGFGTLYHPVKALLICKRAGNETDYYVEGYDMDSAGRPINGHPLSVRESSALAKGLTVSERRTQGFLVSRGLMPANVLHLNPHAEGCAVWHTPPQCRRLLFAESLGVPSGPAQVPALIWKAGKRRLQVYAIAEDVISMETVLCRAPFFNIYADGAVCMGNVQVSFPADAGLEQFMQRWEDYFFNSFFSHSISRESTVKGNIVQLWQQLVSTGETFPADKLLHTSLRLQHLLS